MKKNRIPSEADRRTILAGRCYGALVLTVTLIWVPVCSGFWERCGTDKSP